MSSILKAISMSLIASVLISCGGGSNSSDITSESQTSSTTIQGTVYDDVMANLSYSTQGYDSKTDTNGKFNYISGKVEFYLGKLKIGEIVQMPADKKVFLSDMLNLSRGDYKSEEVVKLARLVQALDSDTDSSKITIDTSKVDEIFKTSQNLDDVNISNLGLTLPSQQEAIAEVKNTYTNNGITLANNAPTANAGADQSAVVGTNVILNASASSDSDGNITSYSWDDNGTTLGTLQTIGISTLSVGAHTITLTVTDNDGASASDTTQVTITKTPNNAPTANAGDDQNVVEGTAVTLDAGKSTDSDGSIASYNWSENGKSLGESQTLTKDDFSVGTHNIILTVTDNSGVSAEDSVTITVTSPANKAPTANAGADQTQAIGKPVTLDGSASTDSDGEIASYIWSDKDGTSLGEGEKLTLSNLPVGENSITLTVTDDDGATDSNTTKVTITNQAPTANAGVDQTITQGDEVTLNASGSKDSDGKIITYDWSESGTSLSSESKFSKSDFSVGTHNITLTITDNGGASAKDSVTITVNSPANKVPTITEVTASPSTVAKNAEVTLSATATDSDGKIAKYDWSEKGDSLGITNPLKLDNLSVGKHTIILTVTDDDGDTATKDVEVTVENQKPVADAGEDKNISQGHLVELDGSGSTDSDGNIVSYRWTEGNTELGTDSGYLDRTGVISDVVGEHTITLTVTDDDGAVATDTVIVTIKDTTPPRVLSSVPTQNATEVAVDTKIVVTFSEDIQDVTSDNIEFHGEDPKESVVLTPSVSGKVLTLTPKSDLEIESKYTISIKSVKDKAGNELASPHNIDFTTVKWYESKVENSDNVVVDNYNKKMWEDQANANTYTWDKAMQYCTDLNYAGYNDWYLPTKDELLSIVNDKSTTPPAIISAFLNKGEPKGYWSSTPDDSESDLARFVHFKFGVDGRSNRSKFLYVRCIRDN